MQKEKVQDTLRKNWDNGVYISQRSIWVQDDLTAAEKLVWMCLEKFANGKDTAWPGISRIATECSLSKRQVVNYPSLKGGACSRGAYRLRVSFKK